MYDNLENRILKDYFGVYSISIFFLKDEKSMKITKKLQNHEKTVEKMNEYFFERTPLKNFERVQFMTDRYFFLNSLIFWPSVHLNCTFLNA